VSFEEKLSMTTITGPEVSIPLGNRKVGRVYTFSLPTLESCPGASDWCRTHCYAHRYEKFRPNVREAYARNWRISQKPDVLVNHVLNALPLFAGHMRIHVAGDFFSKGYIEAWKLICQLRPHTQFWAYTRSWVIPELRDALEELRALPNLELFASVDADMPNPPENWRAAYIQTDPRASGITCPHQEDKVASCLDCGYCFRKGKGDVIFKPH